MSEFQCIEVYEWKEGQPRPGTWRKHRHDCIEILEIPKEGLPEVGDVLLLVDPNDSELSPVPYRVLSREFLFNRLKDDHPQKPADFLKMWVHVRRLSLEAYESDGE